MPNVTLFIPSLVPPPADGFAELPVPGCPALELLLARAGSALAPCATVAQWLCENFGVSRQLDWPVAPLGLLGEGRDPGRSYWLCANPVHLRVQRDQLVLLPPAALPVSEAESRALMETLNRHFAADGLEFTAPHPQRWYLRLPSTPDLQTVALEQAVGQDINRLLPTGEDRMRFHHLFNEVQMLLHDHPVNQSRERSDMLPINSVWFREGGTLPPRGHANWAEAIGDTPLLRGLGQLADVPVAGLSRGPAFPGTGDVLVVLAEAPDDEWAGQIEQLEQGWFSPLLGRVRSGEIRRLDIATVHAGQARQWTITPRDLWKFWRRPRPLGALLREALP